MIRYRRHFTRARARASNFLFTSFLDANPTGFVPSDFAPVKLVRSDAGRDEVVVLQILHALSVSE